MKTNPASQFGLFNLRVCVALLLCSGGGSLAMLSFAVSIGSSEIITTAAASPAPTSVPSVDAQSCAALAELNLEDAPGGPALITSARLVEVPAGGLEAPFF